MARSTFGGTAADYVITAASGGLMRLTAATLTFWDAPTGGNRYTDLLLAGSPVVSIVVGADGQVPAFQGPDLVTAMWADGGAGRVRLVAEGREGPAGPKGDVGAPGGSDTSFAQWLDDNLSATAAAAKRRIDSHLNAAGTLTKADADRLYGSTDEGVGGWVTPVRAVARALGWVIVTDHGVAADGVTNNTAAYDALVAAAEATITNRQGLGVTLYFPVGDYVGTLTVTSSAVKVAGAGSGGTVLRPPSTTADTVKFTHGSLALYNAGISGVRLVCAGNQTAGTSLLINRCIYFRLHDVTLNGHYTGLVLDNAQKVITSGLIMSQEARTAGATGLPLTVQNGCSDVHVTDMQIMRAPTTHGTIAISITGVDGLYFNNCHWHGTVEVSPPSAGTVASVWWTACYFDGSPSDLLRFLGPADVSVYRNFRICNCNFRQGVKGIVFETYSVISRIVVTASQIYDCDLVAVDCRTANIRALLMGEMVFAGNNRNNSATHGDLNLNGTLIRLADFVIDGGGAAGYAINCVSGSDVTITDGDLSASAAAAASKILGAGSSTVRVRNVKGYRLKNRGTVTVAAAATSVVIPHGLAVTPTREAVNLSPYSNLGQMWVSAVDATNITVTLAAGPAGASTLGWSVDMET